LVKLYKKPRKGQKLDGHLGDKFLYLFSVITEPDKAFTSDDFPEVKADQ
jgi:hypothetical protein